MQQLFLMWYHGELVAVECMRVIPSGDPRAAARAQLRRVWADGCPRSDRCTIYLVQDHKLILGGEAVRHENGISS